jgi:hypothetical protein
MDYRFNEASLVLPAELIDKSLQTFILADGEQSFNVVVSRVDLEPEESLHLLCERLLKAWQSQLPQFKLLERRRITVDRQAAAYFDCRWEANGISIHQRQVVTLAPGPKPTEPMNGLIITGTCQKQFVYPYTEVFDEFIENIHWRYAAEDQDESQSELPEYCFALSLNKRTLQVFDDIQDASAQIDPFEVENGLWQFYDDNGTPLYVEWLEPNRRTANTLKPGSYQLIVGNGARDSDTLQSSFAIIDHVEDNPFIRTQAELRHYLQRS